MKSISACILLFLISNFFTLHQQNLVQCQSNGTTTTLTRTNLIITAHNHSTHHSTHDSKEIQSILGTILDNDRLSRLLNQSSNQSSHQHHQQPMINLLNLTVIIINNNNHQVNQEHGEQLMSDSEHHEHVWVDEYIPIFPPLSNIPVNRSDLVSEYRRSFIVNMTREAWSAYTEYSWGQEALRPVSLNEKQPLPKTGETIVAASSTLWLMGLTSEFQRAKQWIKEELNVTEIKSHKEAQLIVSDYMGALLSCFALTGDEMFKDKAKEMADYLISLTNQVGAGEPKEKQMTLQERLFKEIKQLSQFPNQRLEYRYLIDVTNETAYESQLRQNDQLAKAAGFPKSNSIASQNRLMMEVKAFLQLNRTDEEGIRLYNETIHKSLHDKDGQILQTNHNLTLYVRDVRGNMYVSDCNFGALFSLGAKALLKVMENQPDVHQISNAGNSIRKLQNVKKHENLAEQITETCHLAANGTRIGLPPMSFAIENGKNESVSHVIPKITGYGSYLLTANLAESYFVLWRTTGNEKYRTYAWELAQAIQRHCRTTAGGYAQINAVNAEQTQRKDYQPAYFLGATLKYLYLTFSPVDFVPLSQWVFNSAGHPLPVCGGDNAAYAKQCNTKFK